MVPGAVLLNCVHLVHVHARVSAFVDLSLFRHFAVCRCIYTTYDVHVHLSYYSIYNVCRVSFIIAVCRVCSCGIVSESLFSPF